MCAEAFPDLPPSPRATNGQTAADGGAAPLPPQPPVRSAGYVPPNKRWGGAGDGIDTFTWGDSPAWCTA